MLIRDTSFVVEHTANPGQLLSITDSTPYHNTGQTYLDKATGKWYAYAQNNHTTTIAANAPAPLAAANDATSVRQGWATTVISDLGNACCYIVTPCAAIPTTYYGWYQFQGDVTALTGCTNEARTAGDQMEVTGGVLSRAAALGFGVGPKCFGIVRVANTGASTTANVYLIGRECTPGT